MEFSKISFPLQIKIPKVLFLLFAFVCIAIILRVYLLWDNLFFGPEQGIDFLAIRNIAIKHKLTLIGAKTDIEGIFHGPIYYYASVIPFLLGKGSPLIVAYFFIILNCLNIFFIYMLGKTFFSKRVGIIASLLFTVSFGCIVYSRWLSSHPLVIPLSSLFFVFLYWFLKGKKNMLSGAIIAYGLLGQSEFLNFTFFGCIFLAIILFFADKFTNFGIRRIWFNILLLLLFSVGNYILFDLLHKFLISKNLLQLINHSTGYYVSFNDILHQSIGTYSLSFSSFTFPLYPNSPPIMLIVSIFLLIFQIRKGNKAALVLLTWILLPLFVLIILRHYVLEQYFISVGSGLILSVAFLIDRVLVKTRIIGYLLLVIILITNIFAWKNNILHNQNIFFQSTQPDLKYSDELKIIDAIYKNSQGRSFSFQSYTIPYWSQQGWEYLFWYYGQQKYGYLPIDQNAKTLYVIIQDDPSNKSFQNYWLKNIVSKWGKRVGTYRFGVLTLQELSVY